MKKRAMVLDRDVLFEALSYLPFPYRQAGLVAWYSAARVGEVLRLHRDDVRHPYLHYRGHKVKTGEPRVIRITPALAQVLDELPHQGWLFPSQGGRRYPHLTRQAFHAQWKPVVRELGYPAASGHSFRRSAATHLMREGVPLRVIQQVTGHVSLLQLQNYLHVDEAAVIEAMNAL